MANAWSRFGRGCGAVATQPASKKINVNTDEFEKAYQAFIDNLKKEKETKATEPVEETEVEEVKEEVPVKKTRKKVVTEEKIEEKVEESSVEV